MLETISAINGKINAFMWGIPALIVLIGTGVLMTVLTKFFQFTRFGHWWRETIGSIFRSDFGLFYQATRNSGPLTPITQTVDVYVYKALLETANINFSSAASLLQSVCGCITIVIANLVVKKIDPDAGMF